MALNYGGRRDILQAASGWARLVRRKILKAMSKRQRNISYPVCGRMIFPILIC